MLKVAITGHTNGIGKELSKIYTNLGYKVIGLSTSNGYNINDIKTLDKILECDIFINNAYSGFKQVELLYEVYENWKGTHKSIINISSIISTFPVSPNNNLEDNLYRSSKLALDEAHKQLFYQDKVKMILVRPGAVNTNNEGAPSADTFEWCTKMMEIIQSNLLIPEFTLMPNTPINYYKD